MKNLYTYDSATGTEEVLSHIPAKVESAMNRKLNTPYNNDEVKAALFQMFSTKASGLDGYAAHFFPAAWDLCGDEVIDMVL